MIDPNRVPTEADWGDYKDGEDREYAHAIFAGKTRAETMPDFERCVIERADELRFMAPVPFRYYILAFRDHVLSPKLIDDDPGGWAPDAASVFLSVVREKLEEAPSDIRPIIPELLPALEYVASHQALYKAKEDIYGNFPEALARIKALAAD